MGSISRRGLGLGILASMAAGMAAKAQTAPHSDKLRERLLVSVMCTRQGDLVADEASSYTAFHQYREQVLTMEVGSGLTARTMMLTFVDSDAGGVRVSLALLNGQGMETERRDFVMYPFLDLVATRMEPFRVPVMRVVDSGNDQLIEMDRLEFMLTMKRVMRAY